ncbi:hypothetical protein [Paractinoplanes atraurantiacus]|uniref:Lipoprotein LprG n=1 Tax=Paractinoplanes atraurantiacus TaxID=1036182 RepID=A0A285IQ33_9ACTN|nr:hypothetical protein [Actinoplanes atraurantiacus]SNY49807.1 hypothetical protein SAMN05421748_110139 [Actinoplanes atraurantiacus]
MKKSLVILALAGSMLAGCSSSAQIAHGRSSTAAAPSPSPSPLDTAKPDLITALQKTHKAPYKFAVNAAAPEKQRIQGGGTYDPKAKKLSTTTKVTGGDKDPQSRQRIVIAGDLYEKEAGEGTWVHLDLRRIKKDSYLQVDMADPNGLAAFTKSIETVRKTGPRGFSGTFDPSAGKEDFLPIGAPSIWIIGGSADFKAFTDANGWITRIDVQVNNKETLKMTTTFSAHGKPVTVAKPKRVGEAMDFYYD